MTARWFLTVSLLALAVLAAPALAQQLNPDMVKKIDAALPAKATATPAKARKVLIYTNAAGFVHSSIPYGAYAVEAMGKKTGAYSSVTSNDPAVFDNLSGYDAIVMVNTTGDWLQPRSPGGEPKKGDKESDESFEKKLAAWKDAKAAYDKANVDAKGKVESRRKNLLDFLSSGGGLAGFHAASDAQYQWKEFGLIIGGYFWGHPWHEKVPIKLDDETVADYARFFFTYIRGRHGRFIITENVDDINWKEDPPPAARKAIGKMLGPVSIKKKDEKGTYCLEARVMFKDSLFKTDIYVKPDGTVTLTDEELLIEDMPVLDDVFGQ